MRSTPNSESDRCCWMMLRSRSTKRVSLSFGADAGAVGWLSATPVANTLRRVRRVASKFPNIASNYYARENRDIDIIKLHGSIELAPLVGLSDVIVDIVETGKTPIENN